VFIILIQLYKQTADQHRTTIPTWLRSQGQLSGWRDHQKTAAAAAAAAEFSGPCVMIS